MEWLQKTVNPIALEVDTEGARCKTRYMGFARWAAWLGAIAVVFAILQLSEIGKGARWFEYLPWVEFGFALLAVGVAIAGLGAGWQQRWLIARYRAEQLRLLKFSFLCQPELWSQVQDERQSCVEGLKSKVETIRGASIADVEHWLTRGSVPTVISTPNLHDSEWKDLVAYYMDRRVGDQINYLRKKKSEYEDRNSLSKIWPSVLFFGSVAFVLVHFCIDLIGLRAGKEVDADVAKFALLLAASLPVCGAGIRVIRGVLEYGRNASRYESTRNALITVSERLRLAKSPEVAFPEIGFSEQILEADLREWVRLMIEAEWFG